MGLSHNTCTIFSSLQEDVDQRPLMLKDFLEDDRSHSCSSSSSLPIGSDRWYPIKISRKSNDPLKVQLLSRSKMAAMHTISALHKVVNLVKMVPFASGGKVKNDISQDSTHVKVQIRDILRWTSFKDSDVDKSTPLDHLTSIDMGSASGSGSTSSSTSSSRKSSSWSQSDLTADDLPFWWNENKEYFSNRDDMLRKIPKEEWPFEESDQQSPISVLHDSLFLENEGPASPCHTSLSNNVAEGREHVLMRIIQEHEVGKSASLQGEGVAGEVEEKAKMLLSQVTKETGHGEARDDHLMLDFFENELYTFGKFDDLEFNGKILEVAKSWKNGEWEELFEWELEDKRDAFVRDMERELVGWTKFSCEVEEMCKELQIEVCNELLCEVLNDFHAK